MKLIVGLGNPGKKYENTRHNVGFMVLDSISLRFQTKNEKQQLKIQNFKENNKSAAEILKLKVDEKDIILAKPQTFMNKSGEAVQKICQFYKIKPEDVEVICDDINLDLGQIRVRKGGSDGGHNGLKSIIEAIGEDFWRIRIGIGSNRQANSDQQTVNSKPAEDYVLQKFNADEQKIIKKTIDKTAEFILKSISDGLKEETINLNKE